MLYINCEVIYEGRACSTLPRGNYLILIKEDNSVSIHASTKIAPRNCQQAGSEIIRNGNKLIFRNRGETITIIINKIHFTERPKDWSKEEITITKTEKELVDKLFYNWCDYFDGDFEFIYTEYGTELGSIDLLGIRSDLVYYVVEVKRRRCTINSVSQVKRYVDAQKSKEKM